MGLTGTEFEGLVKPFFKQIFEKIGFPVIEIRNQMSGTQNGFDIMISFYDKQGKKRNLFFECKYYSSQLPWSEIFRKQVELSGSNYSVDGFILISPKKNLSNIDHNLQDKAKKSWFGFPSDFWTPDKDVKGLFALDRELFEKVYDEPYTIIIDEGKQLEKIENLVNNLLKEKDTPSKPLAPKNKYNPPPEYIKRKLITSEDDRLIPYFNQGRDILELLKEDNKIALLGSAGTGKSIELLRVAAELTHNSTPYYTFLLKIDTHSEKEIVDYVPEILSIPDNALIILIDGLDQVESKNFGAVTRRIVGFCEDHPNAKVVVSCRSNFYSTLNDDNALNTLQYFKSFYLADLSDVDINEYLKAKLPLNTIGFLKEVSAKNLEKLLYIPYYLIRLVDQYGKKNKISDSKAAFFEDVISDSIQADSVRYFPDNRDSKAIEMRRVLEKLAFILQFMGKSNTNWPELERLFTTDELYLIKCSGSLIDGEEGLTSAWRFNHNNIQEYLAARSLSTRNYWKIKKIVSFKPNYKKVKPKWVNALSFLVSILDIGNSQLSKEIFDWLATDEPQLIISFESDKLDYNLKNKIFSQVFNYYKNEKRRINTSVFRYSELAKLGKSETIMKSLCNELNSDSNIASKANALELMSLYDIGGEFPLLKDEAKRNVERYVYRPSDLQYLAIRAYVDSFKLTEKEFDKLLNTFMDSDNMWIRFVLYYGIHKQGYEERYIVQILRKIKEILHNELNDRNRLGNEYHELRECIKGIHSLNGIKTLLDFIAAEYQTIVYSIYFREIIKNSIKLIKESFPTDEELYQKLKSIFDSKAFRLSEEQADEFIQYFESTNKTSRAFKEIFAVHKNNLEFSTLNQLSWLSNEETIAFMANEFIEERINKSIVEQFQYSLDRYHQRFLKTFNKLVNEKEVIPLPYYKNFEKTKKEQIEKSINLLFNKAAFKEAIEQVFIDAKKDDLNYDEIWDIQKTEYVGKYLPIVYQTTRIYRNNQTRNRIKLLTWIDKNWEEYSISLLIQLLKENKEVKFNSDQLRYIRSWCDSVAKKVDFKNSLSHPEADTTRVDKTAEKLSFLIRKLNYRDYPKELYLDMLSFQRWDDSEVDIFDFVTSIVQKEDIERSVLKNLAEEINFDLVLENHLNYCLKNDLKQSVNLLLPYLLKGGYRRERVLKCILGLGVEVNKLESILPKVHDEFKFRLIQELIDKDSKNVLNYLINGFQIAKKDEDKLKYSRYLITLQNIEGLKFYIKTIKETKRVPDDSHPMNPLYKLTSLAALKYIFELYELSFDESIRQNQFNNLRDITIGALQAICLYKDNFIKANRTFTIYSIGFKTRSFLKMHKLPETAILDLNYYFETMEHKYYVNKDIDVNISEAIAVFTSL